MELLKLANERVSSDPVLYPLYYPPGVMKQEQLDVLKHQIIEYSKICRNLVALHQKQAQAQQRQAGQGAFGNKSTRQRWTPTAVQLQILERIFDAGQGTPSKAKIKEITGQLTEHGPILETNVYNWFQNRKARAKRKQQEGYDMDGNGDGTQWAPVPVVINERQWEVAGGMLDVKGTFGEGFILLDAGGQIVPMSEEGVVLQPIVAGGVYTSIHRSELEGATQLGKRKLDEAGLGDDAHGLVMG